MALRFSHVTGHRHWYFYVLALVCVGWWNAAVLVLPPAAHDDGDGVGSRSPRIRVSSEHRLINLTNFRYAAEGQRSRFSAIRHSTLFVSHSCRNSSHQIRVLAVLPPSLPPST